MNLVEDEIHFLCFCPRYQELRTELYQNVLSLDCLFPQYTDTEKLRILMHDRFVKPTINFIYGAWQLDRTLCLFKNTYVYIYIYVLYGCEVWAPEDCVILEKLQLRFCKYILSVSKCTYNNIVYGELGVLPLKVHVKCRAICFGPV